MFRLWTDDDLDELSIPADMRRRASSLSELSNIARYEIVSRYGGVYLDTDFECLRSLDPLLHRIEAFAGFSRPGNIAPGLFGAVQGHPAIRRVAELSRLVLGKVRRATGPALFTHVLWDFPEVTLFPPKFFYPYLWTERHRRHERFPDAYAVHHWAMSWVPTSPS